MIGWQDTPMTCARCGAQIVARIVDDERGVTFTFRHVGECK